MISDGARCDLGNVACQKANPTLTETIEACLKDAQEALNTADTLKMKLGCEPPAGVDCASTRTLCDDTLLAKARTLESILIDVCNYLHAIDKAM